MLTRIKIIDPLNFKMGPSRSTKFSTYYFLILSLSHQLTLARISHNDCDGQTIKDNFVRVCGAYPSAKRSVSPFHYGNPYGFNNRESSDSPDAILFNFPQSPSYTMGIQSFKMPIISNPDMFQIHPGGIGTSSYQQPPQILQQPGWIGMGPQINQQPRYPNNLQFGSYPQQNFPNSRFPLNPNFQAPNPSIPDPNNWDNVISWLGLANMDSNSMDPVARWRRDWLRLEIENFINGECCSEKGCPFPKAYINLDKRINMCKRR